MFLFVFGGGNSGGHAVGKMFCFPVAVVAGFHEDNNISIMLK